MPTFYQKTPASGQNCLILEPGEALIYPFDFGDWQELRLSVFTSMTTIDDDNKKGISESIDSQFIPRLIFWFGAKDNSEILPYTSGSIFAGFSSAVLDGAFDRYTQINTDNNIIEGNFNGYVSLSGKSIYGAKSGGTRFYSFTHAGHLPTGFAGFNSIGLKRTGNYLGYMGYRSQDGALGYTDVSIDNLRKLNKSFSITYNTGSSTIALAYLPPELNCLFLWSPFTFNRIRVHSLLVEQLA